MNRLLCFLFGCRETITRVYKSGGYVPHLKGLHRVDWRTWTCGRCGYQREDWVVAETSPPSEST